MSKAFFPGLKPCSCLTPKASYRIALGQAKEWDGRPARLFCFIRYGRDARATLCHDRTEHVDLGRTVFGPLLALLGQLPNDLNISFQAIRRIIHFPDSPRISVQASAKRNEDHAFVRESLDLLRKQGDPQSGCDETNHGGLSVSVLQNSRSETGFPTRISERLVGARTGLLGHSDKKQRLQILEIYFDFPGERISVCSEMDKTQVNLALIEGVVLLARCHVEQI